MKKNIIENYQKSCTELVELFVKKILKTKTLDKNDYFIVWEFWELWPELVIIQDFYNFTLSEIFVIMKHNIPMEIVEEWYEKKWKKHCKKEDFMSIYQFFEGKTVPKKELIEKRRKDLEQSKEKVFSSMRELYTILWVSEEKLKTDFENLKI